MISIIIINYNSTKHLESNLLSIRKSKLPKTEVEIIVLDNNSKNKPNEDILKKYNVSYYKSKVNMGYSKALNYAITKINGRYILILNPDVIVKKNSIMNLYNYYTTNKVGVLGTKVLNLDSTFQLSSRRRFPYFKYLIPYLFKINKINFYNYSDIDNNTIHEVDSISGCCMFFSKEVYDLTNGFDERFFLYFEDTDFCIKIKKIGLNVIYYPLSEIFHIKYGSRNFNNYLYVKYHFYKSFFLFSSKYFYKYFLNR